MYISLDILVSAFYLLVEAWKFVQEEIFELFL